MTLAHSQLWLYSTLTFTLVDRVEMKLACVGRNEHIGIILIL